MNGKRLSKETSMESDTVSSHWYLSIPHDALIHWLCKVSVFSDKDGMIPHVIVLNGFEADLTASLASSTPQTWVICLRMGSLVPKCVVIEKLDRDTQQNA